MPIGEVCNKEIITVQSEDSVLDAAKLMRQNHVGDVLVVENRNGIDVPIGIVTDRDLVMEIMAPELDSSVITVGDIMAPEFTTVKESAGLFEAIQHMRNMAVRRLPVVDETGQLVGIVTLDDLLVLLADELHALARLVTREQQKEIHTRP
ncbi:MAG: CBS domain-containing protein [Alphaproteobacteria bacterium]